MYRRIFVPVDNSDHSQASIDLAVRLARTCGAAVVGAHAYAAGMHDLRFKQMEYTLPDEYRQERALERQRAAHDSLIGTGLKLVSDCYLGELTRAAAAAGVTASTRTYDGRNFSVLVDDIRAHDYDLVVLGALGTGAVKDSQLGSVCERVVRRVAVDTLVVRDLRPAAEQAGGIVVGIDGSPQSFGGLLTALELGQAFQRPVEAVAAYDPYLHYAVFARMVKVLDAAAARAFRFAEQEELHERVIDGGLARIYRSHLDIARALAAGRGVALKTTLLDGKACERILDHARAERPWLLVLGRIGVHSGPDMDIGSNAENVLRRAPCNVLLSSRVHVPDTDLRAEAALVWSDEAKARLERVPAHVRGIARAGIHRFALERGHSVVTSSVIDGALGAMLPARMARALGTASADAAGEAPAAPALGAWICGRCGHAVRGARPASCALCESPRSAFAPADRPAAVSPAPTEGALLEETAFDGVKIRWTTAARALVDRIEDAQARGRARARIEKTARMRHIDPITSECAGEIVREAGPGVDA